MRNVLDKVVEKFKTHILSSLNYFSPKIAPFMRKYEFIISHKIILRMRNVLDKVVEKFKTHILSSLNYFSPENRAVYEKMWKKKCGRAGHATDGNIIRGMRVALWVT
jgi:hypothetical protein